MGQASKEEVKMGLEWHKILGIGDALLNNRSKTGKDFHRTSMCLPLPFFLSTLRDHSETNNFITLCWLHLPPQFPTSLLYPFTPSPHPFLQHPTSNAIQQLKLQCNMQVMQVYHLLPKVHNGQKTRQQLKPHPSNCATSRMEIDRRRRSDEPTQDYGNRREEMEGRKDWSRWRRRTRKAAAESAAHIDATKMPVTFSWIIPLKKLLQLKSYSLRSCPMLCWSN